MKPNQKNILSVLAITAVVLCTLPFLVRPAKNIYVYTVDSQLGATEKSFITQLNKAGFKVFLNPQTQASKDAYALWFASPEYAQQLSNISFAKYDFIYSEIYYPVNWHEVKKNPIMLTPYQDLYEHYMRSNIKSAVLDIREPTAAKRFAEIYNWLKENN